MILIPTYNSRISIEKTIISALNQTKKVNVIVVDNNSIDGTAEIAKKYGVEVIVNRINLGRISNWNQCITIAKERNKPYFKILFAGDILKDNAMEEYERVFEDESIGLITSKYEVFEKDGSSRINQTVEKERSFSPKEALLLNLERKNWFASPSIQAFRTDSVKNVKFDERLPWAADWQFCIELSKQTNVYYIDQVLAEFHINSRKYYEKQNKKLSSKAEELYILTSLMDELGLADKFENKIRDNLINDCIPIKDVIKYFIKRVFNAFCNR